MAFASIQKTPTPTPTRTPRVRTPRPTPTIEKVLAVEDWRLAGVFKGKAYVERKRKKDFVSHRDSAYEVWT